MTKYWLLIGSEEYWIYLLKEGYWALKKRWKRKSNKIKKGDKAVAYVKYVSAIYGILSIVSDPYEERKSILEEDTDLFPIRFKIKPELVLENPKSIKPLINRLSFIKNKKRWYSYFQTSIRELSKEDFELIYSYLKRKVE